MEPDLCEAESSEELGFFFKRLGELCFSPAAAQAHPGPASSLAVAARAGAVFFSDAQGAQYWCMSYRRCMDQQLGCRLRSLPAATQCVCCRLIPASRRRVRMPHRRSAAPPADMGQLPVSGRAAVASSRRWHSIDCSVMLSALLCSLV